MHNPVDRPSLTYPVGMQIVEMTAENGTLSLLTGVEGAASRMGHALVLGFDDWRADVEFRGETPVSVRVEIELSSLAVVDASGGLKPLSDGDRRAIVRNALDTLRVDDHPKAEFVSSAVTAVGGGYEVQGSVSVAGAEAPMTAQVSAVDAGAHWNISGTAEIRHSELGISPYSTMLGALKVSDAAQLEFTAAMDK